MRLQEQFSPTLLDLQRTPPSPLPSTVARIAVGLFAVALTWACVGHIDVVADAQGKLVPSKYVQVVQPAESGVVTEILVADGESVKAGQTLIRLDRNQGEADLTELKTEIQQEKLMVRRIDAELSSKPFVLQVGEPVALYQQVLALYTTRRAAQATKLAQEQAGVDKLKADLASAKQVQSKLTQVLPSYKASESTYQNLQKQGLASNLTAQEKERDRIEKEQDLRAQDESVESSRYAIAQAERRVAEVVADYQKELQSERVDLLNKQLHAEQELIKQDHKNSQLELKAPVDGVVKDIVPRTIGAVVSPGSVVLTIVPAGQHLRAEVWVRNEDAGFVYPGQTVQLKVAAFPFQKYGLVKGTIAVVSADASESSASGREGATGDVSDSNKQPPSPGNTPEYYRVLVELSAQSLDTQGESHALKPGMQVVAEINQGNRTVMEYLLSPVQKAISEAAKER